MLGCGCATHHTDVDDAIIVRLSKGIAWTLPGTIDRSRTRPLFVTGDEVFRCVLTQSDAGAGGIVRVQLATPGEGPAPD